MTIIAKVYILLEDYDNGKLWEEHYWYYRQFAGVFPTEDAAKVRIKELYDKTEYKSSALKEKDGEYSWTAKIGSGWEEEEEYTYTIVEEEMKIEIKS